MASPIKKGVPKNYTLDADAIELLRILAPSHMRHGSFISELIRREWHQREARRAERERIKQLLVADEGDL
jgi:hypothetical protein